jgi:hypothetical protein
VPSQSLADCDGNGNCETHIHVDAHAHANRESAATGDSDTDTDLFSHTNCHSDELGDRDPHGDGYRHADSHADAYTHLYAAGLAVGFGDLGRGSVELTSQRSRTMKVDSPRPQRERGGWLLGCIRSVRGGVVLLLFVPVLARAQLAEFTPGTPILSEQVNANFRNLDDRVKAGALVLQPGFGEPVEVPPGSSGEAISQPCPGGFTTISCECDTNLPSCHLRELRILADNCNCKIDNTGTETCRLQAGAICVRGLRQ